MNLIYDFLSSALPFAWAEYKFMVNAFIAVLLIAPLMGILGTMAVNNKMAFFSDALGHSALTGVALGVLLGIENEIISLLAFGVLTRSFSNFFSALSLSVVLFLNIGLCYNLFGLFCGRKVSP